MTLGQRAHVLSAAAVVAAAATAGTARAADAPLRLPAPDSGALKRTTKGHIELRLLPGFEPANSPSSGAVVDGLWERQFGSGASGCTVTFGADGKGRRARPRASRSSAPWDNGRFSVDQTGTVDSLRWYVGRSGATRIGLATLPMPAGIAPARVRWATVQLRLDRGAGVARVCDAAIAKLTPQLRSSLRRVKVVRGR